MSSWMWPQWAYAAFSVLSLVLMINKDLREPTAAERWHGLLGTFLAVAIVQYTLYAGGFWTP